jgi:hypothetical protein
MYISTGNILRLAFGFFASAIAISSMPAAPSPSDGPQFSVSFPKERSAQPLDGRVLVLLSTDPSQEPRMQIDLSVTPPSTFEMFPQANTTFRQCSTATKPSIAPTVTL